jgi:hypothetical protein
MSLRTSMLSLALLAAPAAAGVVVVDPASGDGGALLLAALAGAHDGDVILVRPGQYTAPPAAAYDMPDLSLALVADAGGARIALGMVRVTKQSAGHELVIRGFDITPVGIYQNEVAFCDGSVRFEDCTAVGAPGFSFPNPFVPETWIHFPGQPAFLVASAADLVFERCTLAGGDGQDGNNGISDASTPGGAALELTDSRVVFSDCTVTGGVGGGLLNSPIGPAIGGPGLQVNATSSGPTQAFLLGSHVSGGAGGDSPATGGTGGPGLAGGDAGTILWQRAAEVAGGAGGQGAVRGSAGPASTLVATVTSFGAAWGSAIVPAPLREGGAATLELSGGPGDLALVVMSIAHTLAPLKAKQAPLLVDPLGLVGPIVLGTLDGSGHLSLPFTVPHLPDGLDGLVFPLQLALTSGAGTTLGGATEFVWIDAAF